MVFGPKTAQNQPERGPNRLQIAFHALNWPQNSPGFLWGLHLVQMVSQKVALALEPSKSMVFGPKTARNQPERGPNQLQTTFPTLNWPQTSPGFLWGLQLVQMVSQKVAPALEPSKSMVFGPKTVCFGFKMASNRLDWPQIVNRSPI